MRDKPWSHVPDDVDYLNAWKWEPKMVAEARRRAHGRIGQRQLARIPEMLVGPLVAWLETKLPKGTK
jgi:hypothetical protein